MVKRNFNFVTFFSALIVFGTSLTDATAYASLKDDQKAHPNATFHIHSNGYYTYYYGTQKPTWNTYENPGNTNTTGFASNNAQNQATYQPATPAIHRTVEKPVSQNTAPITAPPSLPNVDAPHSTDALRTKAFKKDDQGLITTINTDTLFKELQLLHFNEEALTEDGKPLALGNGKIIDQPIYTDKNNLYTPGQCTWYVFSKRAQAGKMISTFWGDAHYWVAKALSEGFTVNHTPEVGTILQNNEGPYGHVAYVERVNLDGSILISEMNYIAPYITSTRTIPASAVHLYHYIH
ncbi:CHAP domain-containing protein [Staphylococcus lutrae]|uniref:Peptidase C51 domain-containing protein n=1 Tax=Staphylococcus lutrae TaxID=155085 RepID=A0AAC9RPB9_9STAP|nr:CHAP domain-containing protein [Staphylococcus lutrae]ARJ50991.1 hypothetical protein B5P37_06495 [Staphylococcus lutrae]PNZ37130.1 CHAP domain-containing protein [Staphylococcus lutrae]